MSDDLGRRIPKQGFARGVEYANESLRVDDDDAVDRCGDEPAKQRAAACVKGFVFPIGDRNCSALSGRVLRYNLESA
jgi:hypothetical protein